ncbi:copper resistance protein B [Aliarcobacter butzleri]|nr:copper resistance protein B [Aliarcobacter butzleri]MCG3707302.1 copper resistance protein B [Aliarcobacter butzleri]MCG3709540.1 copper resistance protein B [Aliarcobacter butzleri]
MLLYECSQIRIEWNKNLGNTNDISSLDEVYAVAGVRFWF